MNAAIWPRLTSRPGENASPSPEPRVTPNSNAAAILLLCNTDSASTSTKPSTGASPPTSNRPSPSICTNSGSASANQRTTSTTMSRRSTGKWGSNSLSETPGITPAADRSPIAPTASGGKPPKSPSTETSPAAKPTPAARAARRKNSAVCQRDTGCCGENVVPSPVPIVIR